jgi:hypothetical protein
MDSPVDWSDFCESELGAEIPHVSFGSTVGFETMILDIGFYPLSKEFGDCK